MTLDRLEDNPLLTPDDLSPTDESLSVMCTLNPAAVKIGNETLLLVRVGEQARSEAGYATYLRYDEQTDTCRVERIALSDPDLDTSDPRGVYYRGKMLLTSMSHLRVARSVDGRRFKFDDRPAIFPANAYESFGCEDARITFIDGRYLITYLPSPIGEWQLPLRARAILSLSRDMALSFHHTRRMS